MSQGAIVISSGTGLQVRTAINAALARLQTRASGTGRPSDIAQGEEWFETDNPGGNVWSLWRWTGSADSLIGLFNVSSGVFTSYTSPTTTRGDLVKRGVTVDERFAIGTAFQFPQVNSAGNDLAYQSAGWVKIAADAAPASVASVSVASIPSTIKHFKMVFRIRPATNAVNLWLRYSQGGGIQSSTDYRYGHRGISEAGTEANAGSASDSRILLTLASNAVKGADADEFVFGEIIFPAIHSTGFKRALFRTGYQDSSAVFWGVEGWGGCFLSGNPLDGAQLLFSSGNIAEGTISYLGVQG